MSLREDGWGFGGAQARGAMTCCEEHPGLVVWTQSLLCSPSGVRGPAYPASGQTPGESLPAPLAASSIAGGFRRHLRLRFCGGWGCSGGGLLGQ